MVSLQLKLELSKILLDAVFIVFLADENEEGEEGSGSNFSDCTKARGEGILL